MKSYALYEKEYRDESLCRNKSVLCFVENPLYAIDREEYPSREDRRKLCNMNSFFPFWVAQDLFMKLIRIADQLRVEIRSIEFYLDIPEDIQYDIQADIDKKAYSNLCELIEDVKEEYDTNIKSISLDYKRTLIRISNEGILNMEVEIAKEFVNDSMISNVLFGK